MQVGDYHEQSDDRAHAPQLAEPLGSDGQLRSRAYDMPLRLPGSPETLVQVGGKEPGLIRRPDKMVHPYLTGMDDGHAETSESGVE
jgi:hypothetical protein